MNLIHRSYRDYDENIFFSRFLRELGPIRIQVTYVKMKLKQIFSLKNQKQLYLIEEDDGEFLYRVNKINKYALSIKCRKKKCPRRLLLNPIQTLR